MASERNRAIRERAYALWVESGHQDGRSEEYWLQAERELESASGRLDAAADGASAGAGSAPAAAIPTASAKKPASKAGGKAAKGTAQSKAGGEPAGRTKAQPNSRAAGASAR